MIFAEVLNRNTWKSMFFFHAMCLDLPENKLLQMLHPLNLMAVVIIFLIYECISMPF